MLAPQDGGGNIGNTDKPHSFADKVVAFTDKLIANTDKRVLFADRQPVNADTTFSKTNTVSHPLIRNPKFQ